MAPAPNFPNINPDLTELDERSKFLRGMVIDAIEGGGRGHLGSSMSLIEIFRVIYDSIAQHKPEFPNWPERDRVILSKGHGCLALYSILANHGYFPPEALKSFCNATSILGGHPERGKVPGVEASTGSLGHGLAIGIGIALAFKIQKVKNRVFVIMGDGEINEGSVWEAAMHASKHKLNKLCIIIDYNKYQSYGKTAEVLDLEPLFDKWKAFGCATVEVDGHDCSQLEKVLKTPLSHDKPSTIICHTIKGKGIPFAENEPTWHHKSKIPDDQILQMRKMLEQV